MIPRVIREGAECDWDEVQVRVEEYRGNLVVVRRHEGQLIEISQEQLDLEVSIRRLKALEGRPLLLPEKSDIPVAAVPLFTQSSAVQNRGNLVLAVYDALIARGIRSFTPSIDLKLQIDDVLLEMSIDVDKARLGAYAFYNTWRKIRKAGGDRTRAYPKYEKRGVPSAPSLTDESEKDRRINPVTQAIIDRVLGQYDEAGKFALKTARIYKEVISDVHSANKQRPPDKQIPGVSRGTVRNRIREKFTPRDLAEREYGKDYADERFRNSSAGLQVSYINECTEIDDTDGNVYLIDEDTERAVGTCWVTFAVDKKSFRGKAVTFNLSGVGSEAALSAYLLSVKQKDHSHPDFKDCKNKLDAYGYSGNVRIDNGSGNASRMYALTMAHMGVNWSYARPFHGSDKDSVERLNNHYSRFAEGLPGGQLDANGKLDSKRAELAAEFTLTGFRQRVTKWFVDEEPERIGLTGKSSRERWEEQLSLITPELPRNPVQLVFLEYWLVDMVKLNRASGGFVRNTLRYQSRPLEELRSLSWEVSLVVRINPDDLRAIYVLNPRSQTWMLVPCIDEDRPIFAINEWSLKYMHRQWDVKRYGKRSGAKWLKEWFQIFLNEVPALERGNTLTDRFKAYLIKDVARTLGQLEAAKPAVAKRAEAKLHLVQSGLAPGPVDRGEQTPLKMAVPEEIRFVKPNPNPFGNPFDGLDDEI